MRGRDELIEMMLRRIRRRQAAAKEQLDALHDQHRGIEEVLIGVFGKVLETAQDQEDDAAFGGRVRKLLVEQGGVEALAQQCETVSAWHRDNALPLLWHERVIGWGNLTVADGQLRAEFGYTDRRAPRNPAFRDGLELELSRIRTFLGVQ